MIDVGIDAISFYTPQYYLALSTLAKAHGADPDSFARSTGQTEMAVTPPDEDIVSMAANASLTLLQQVDVSQIDTLLFATETGIDASKAAGIYVHQLLGLPERCRTIELKQACYSATAAIHLALPMLQQNPDRKILIIAADIARYELGSSAESSQGSGAIAMLLSAHPRVLSIHPQSGFYTEDAMDFWRPTYRREALFAGKLSCDLYLKCLRQTWQQYLELTQFNFNDHAHFCYHTPVPRLVEQAHKRLAKMSGITLDRDALTQQLDAALQYNRRTGNCYTASLYISLLSLLENSAEDLTGKRIGLFSYGSGAVAEFFSGTVQANYQQTISQHGHLPMLDARTAVDYDNYVAFHQLQLPTDGSQHSFETHHSGAFRFAAINNHQRIYEKSA